MLRCAMSEPIPIRGELQPDPEQCRFHVDVPLIEEGWTVSFQRDDDWAGSALAESLFTLDGVEKIRIDTGSVLVTKSVPQSWTEMAAEVVPLLREALGRGDPLVSAEALTLVKSAPVDEILETVAQLFEEHINPALASHGGFARLVKVEERDVYLEMGGGCQGCAASQATLRQGIETAIRQLAPQVRNVIDMTDHDAGTNPYYAS